MIQQKFFSPPWLVLCMLALATLGCAAGDLFVRPTPTPVPTRIAAPTFTTTPDFMQGLVVVTPPNQGTPGVIVIPPGVDPRSVIPLPETPTPAVTPMPPDFPTETPATGSQPDFPTETPAAVSPLVVATSVTNPVVTAVVTNGSIVTSTVSVSVGVTVEQNIPLESTPTPAEVLFPEPPATSPASNPPLVLPTITPSLTPTETPIPLPTPTPFILVTTGLVSLRSGPGPEFPLVAQLGPDIPVAIVGRNPEGTWYEICCVNGGSVWVAQSHVQTINDTSQVGLVLAGPAPTATETGTPTSTPTVTPTPTATPYGFQVIEGPLYFPSNNEMLTIWAKISAAGGQVPLPGYYVKVLFRNRADGSSFEDRPNTKGEAPSTDFFEYNVPPGPGSGNRVQYNYKFEFLPPDPKSEDPSSTLTRASLMDGYWSIYVVDGSGRQLSDAIQFDTLAGNINREVFVAWSLTQ